ncbi:ATP-dependent DNA ligase [Rhodococcus rhodnii]|uniref:DNA ligase (ATP) n=2 Tax=Rhodococcus rhodnii TaxID=38312 RepID=R7WR06_9NOCA|nr:ATP-dependent DNA ligase [Rhodococcus rhodnii]EOM77748.1 ATP-dependent DNA ligase [Rhodococcus rhodnii LMG 5362]TXG89028.1 ATP-dependent DNA ligase [Rhodococcus rhodnii]
MAKSETVHLDGQTISLSNLDKVLYPETGTTKGQVIDYYTRIASVMLPHMAGRPVTRKRWPNGVDAESFFEKNLAASAPKWIETHTVTISRRSVRYPVFDSVAGLAWAGQQAALELHVPQWRFVPGSGDDDERGAPTRLVFDLDPGDGVGLRECAEVARAIRDLVAGLGWSAFPVTSGSKGMHVYVPLDRQLASGGASTVAKEVATGLATTMPELVTATMAKAARPGKVFVDWSQNNPAKTTIAPYSLRGRAAPWVAAPRTWDELDDPELSQVRFDEVLTRVDSGGDLLAELDPALGDDPLTAYRSMRDASKTPEPVPISRPAVGRDDTFVIQEHHARRLHWDFRLERDGVLVSWALPKGIPDDPATNHLAVHTEDHPLEYATFAGTIPKGEYGGGAVSIWDSGTYETEKWRDDEVIVRLHGDRAQGRFALIRTKGGGTEREQWLIHRMKDQDDDAAAKPAGKRAPFPTGLKPMLASPGTLSDVDDTRWQFEGKWDGVRIIAEFRGGELVLRSRIGRDKTSDYDALGDLADRLEGHDVVLDGEVVAFDAQGVSSFQLLQNGGAPTYLVFDVLYLDGVSLLTKPLSDRRRVLDALATKTGIEVPPLLGGGADAAREHSLAQGWEGIVAKRTDSVYRPGKRGRTWLKIKNWHTQEVVVGGYTRGQGARSSTIGALLMGIHRPGGEEGGKLDYIGKVGTGFTERDLDELHGLLAPLERKTSPFAGDVPRADAKDPVWVTPKIVGEVRYFEWTSADRLRHPSWRGIRDDKNAYDVVRER